MLQSFKKLFAAFGFRSWNMSSQPSAAAEERRLKVSDPVTVTSVSRHAVPEPSKPPPEAAPTTKLLQVLQLRKDAVKELTNDKQTGPVRRVPAAKEAAQLSRTLKDMMPGNSIFDSDLGASAQEIPESTNLEKPQITAPATLIPPAVESGGPVVVAPSGPVAEVIKNAPEGLEPVSGMPRLLHTDRVFYTGRLKVGKDHIAAQTGAKILSFADPLYALRAYFFGEHPKDAHGGREWLQMAGQVGRGEFNAQYPMSLARAALVGIIRSLAEATPVAGHPEFVIKSGFLPEFDVDWSRYGFDKDIWLNALLARAAKISGRVCATNVRFVNEYQRLSSEGWVGYHVMCSPATWKSRMESAGLKSTGPAIDLSEQLAARLDADVNKKLSQQPRGAKLRVIWNDERVPCPSARLYTPDEFLAAFKL